MNEEELHDRESCISNFLSIMPEYVKAVSVSDGQCDIKIIRKDGTKFRYGYFDRWTFWRENPVCRVLREHGLSMSEGDVGFLSEPQYDMVIEFTSKYSEIRRISDSRTQYEVDYNFDKYIPIAEKIRNLLAFRKNYDDAKDVKQIETLLNFYDSAKKTAQRLVNREKAHQKFERFLRFDESKYYTYCVDGEEYGFEDSNVCPNCGVVLVGLEK